jgi:hypothetical protein
VVGCLVLCGIPGLAIVAAIAIPNLLAAQLSANETAAIATLRNLASCQAQVQTSGLIDVDKDGIGEYGTFLELTGAVGVRAPGSADGSKRGRVISPPIMSAALAQVDRTGIVTKSGYAFAIFLPDASGRGWVHETGPAATAALSGPVGADAAEVRWCAYAWPIARGNSGNRCFFVNDAGDVLQSHNEVYPHQGAVGLPDPGSAFLPGGTGLAIGTTGADGNVWKVTN